MGTNCPKFRVILIIEMLLKIYVFLMKSAKNKATPGPRASHPPRKCGPGSLFKSPIAPTATRFKPILFFLSKSLHKTTMCVEKHCFAYAKHRFLSPELASHRFRLCTTMIFIGKHCFALSKTTISQPRTCIT